MRGSGDGGAVARVVAFGGGHGLAASLAALRRLGTQLTAVVTVADDGGSSGRIRRELGLLPPGDLRMALVALAGDPPPGGIDWATLLQHRLGGHGTLAGHPVGNLLLTGLLEDHADPVAALDALAATICAVGRVLPLSATPLELVAEVSSTDPDDPVRRRTIRGQSAIAATVGHVRDLHVLPATARPCPDVTEAVARADAIVLGPGSWYTSVIPHLLLDDLARALAHTAATVIVALNLVPQAGETDGFSATQHLRVLRSYAPWLRVDVVLADSRAVVDRADLQRFCASTDTLLLLHELADGSGVRHDPVLLADAFAAAMSMPNAPPTRRDEA